MKMWKKLGVALCLGTVLVFGNHGCFGVQTVYGAESSVIEKVSVTFKASFGEQEEIPVPEITVSGSDCAIQDYEFGTDYEKWKPGKPVRVEINIKANEGKYFPVSLDKSQCRVSGAEFVSAKAAGDGMLQVKAEYTPIMVLGDTKKAGWNSSAKHKAVWEPVKFAPGYTVELYGDDKLVKRLDAESNSIDLSEYMQDTGQIYYYEVKAVPTDSDERKYLKEGNKVTSSDQDFFWEAVEEEAGGSDDGGSLKGDSYVLPGGKKVRNAWEKVAGSWFYFDDKGKRVRGWLPHGGKWYLMDEDGIMRTGWAFADRNWYYLGPSGDMKTGWIQPEPGAWYYMDSTGRMRTGWIHDGANWYFLDSNGRMVVNSYIDGWTIGPDGIAHQG